MNEHFSNELIDDINNNTSQNYFSKIIVSVIDKTSIPEKTLDVGCGNGIFSEILKKKYNSHLVGIDGNKYGLEICKSRGFDKTYYVKDFSKDDLIMLDDLSFDLVISKDVLEHLVNPEHAINQMWKKIKKGGYFLVHVPNHFPLLARLKFLFNNEIDTFSYFPNHKRYNFPHLRFYDYKSIIEMLSKFNFEIIENYAYNFFVFPFLNKFLSNNMKKKIIKKFPNDFSEAYCLLVKKN